MDIKEDLKYIIALPLLTEVGTKTAKELIHFFGSAKDIFTATEADLRSIPNIHSYAIRNILSSKQRAISRAQKEMEFIEKHQLNVYYINDSQYPYRLLQCTDAPLLLYGKGNLNVSMKHMLSVVGTRMPTDRGKERCRNIVLDLAKKVDNLCIVSGLAYGIDVTAHKAAIEAGIPTIIIPGHGLDRIYPYDNRNVAIKALEHGGILTEYMSGTTPDRQNFIARNRIIAGLSDATLVVESKEKGGSLITADMAFTYDRDVFAVPGRPEDNQSKGCNNLIKQQKAALVETADDIVAAMRWETKEQKQQVQTEILLELSPNEETLMNILRQEPDGIHINLLILQAKMAYGLAAATLMQMELKGLCRSLPGGIYRALK